MTLSPLHQGFVWDVGVGGGGGVPVLLYEVWGLSPSLPWPLSGGIWGIPGGLCPVHEFVGGLGGPGGVPALLYEGLRTLPVPSIGPPWGLGSLALVLWAGGGGPWGTLFPLCRGCVGVLCWGSGAVSSSLYGGLGVPCSPPLTLPGVCSACYGAREETLCSLCHRSGGGPGGLRVPLILLLGSLGGYEGLGPADGPLHPQAQQWWGSRWRRP